MLSHSALRKHGHQAHSPVNHNPRVSRNIQGRLIIFLTIVSSAFTLRIAVTSLTPLLGGLQQDLGFSSTILGIFGTLPGAIFGISGLVVPSLVHRLGIEKLALMGTVLTCVGLIGRGFAQDTGEELTSYAVALCGMGIGNVVTPPLAKRYFSDRIAHMSMCYTLAVQLGAIVPPLLAVRVQQQYGWRVSVSLWAILPLLVIPLMLWVMQSGHRVAPQIIGNSLKRVSLVTVAKSGRAWGMAILFGVTSLNSYAMMTWLPARLATEGVSAQQGSLMLALYSVVGLAGPLIVVPLLSRVTWPFVFVLCGGLCHLAGFAGLLWCPTTAAFLWTTLIGLGPITFAMNLALIGILTRTDEFAAALSGFGQGIGYAVSMAGPFLFGVFYEITGGWAVSFAFLSCTVVIGMVAGWFVCQGGYIEEEVMGTSLLKANEK